jgi:hypothetical protein
MLGCISYRSSENFDSNQKYKSNVVDIKCWDSATGIGMTSSMPIFSIGNLQNQILCVRQIGTDGFARMAIIPIRSFWPNYDFNLVILICKAFEVKDKHPILRDDLCDRYAVFVDSNRDLILDEVGRTANDHTCEKGVFVHFRFLRTGTIQHGWEKEEHGDQQGRSAGIGFLAGGEETEKLHSATNFLTNEFVDVFIVTDFEIIVDRQLTERVL